MLGMDKDKSVVITGKYAEELRDAIRRKYEGDKPEQIDLEEEIKRYIPRDQCPAPDFMETVARHFAEWQKKQDEKTIELAEEHAYFAGGVNEREKMMEGAVECVVCAGMEGNKWIMTYIGSYESMLTTCKAGDKVKIIIVKEEG